MAMTVISSLHLVIIGVSIACWIIYKLLLGDRPDYSKLPPGPKPHYLQGNQIPPLPWLWYHQLGKQYGPLVTIWEGRIPVVVCNSVKT